VAAAVTLLWRSGAGVAFAAASVAGLAQRDMLDVEPGWWLLAAAVLGLLVADHDRSCPRTGEPALPLAGRFAAAPVLLAVTVFGVWVTVPETQHVVVLMGAALPVAAVAFLRPTSLGIPGAFAAVAVLAWVIEVDGQARDGAVVGSIACLGLLLFEPVLRRAVLPHVGPAPGRGSSLPRPGAGPGWRTFAVHVVLVAWCSRVAGMQDGAAVAWVLVAVGYAVAGVVVARMRTGVGVATS
jgi:hypothetical protein